MIRLGITFALMTGLRILAEWLAGQFEFMQSWLIWFTLIMAASGVVFLISVIMAIVRLIRDNKGKKEKKIKEGKENE